MIDEQNEPKRITEVTVPIKLLEKHLETMFEKYAPLIRQKSVEKLAEEAIEATKTGKPPQDLSHKIENIKYNISMRSQSISSGFGESVNLITLADKLVSKTKKHSNHHDQELAELKKNNENTNDMSIKKLEQEMAEFSFGTKIITQAFTAAATEAGHAKTFKHALEKAQKNAAVNAK